MQKEKTLKEIIEKIEKKEAIILTANELCEKIKLGETYEMDDIDVVTTATRGIMSGTYAVLSFEVAPPDTFIRASKVWLNGVKGQIGPCPNERIGILDIIVNGTEHSKYNHNYGGGHLFRDLVDGKLIKIEFETIEGFHFKKDIYLKDMPHAKLFATRHAFKNYLAFTNPSKELKHTIFHTAEFKGNLKEATISGCGEINPIENDPNLETIGVGTKVLINGAEGFVIGTGTRSSSKKPNLSGFANMHNMNPEYMGGFITSNGPEIINSWAIPIPVLNTKILENLIKLDDKIPLTVVDVNNRLPLCSTNYGDAWNGTDFTIKYNENVCINCEICLIEKICPMNAININGVKKIHELCFNCGYCISKCEYGAFSGNLGNIHYDDGVIKKEIPITLRQSDRMRAIQLSEELKNKIISKKFLMTEFVNKLIL